MNLVRQTQAKERESQAGRRLVDILPTLSWCMVGRWVFASPRATLLSRAASLREMPGLKVRNLLHPDFRKFVQFVQ
jgi:hypothetical protein